MVEWARVSSHTSRPNRKPRLWQAGIWLVNPVICFTSMEALARRLQGIVWGTFPVSYKLIIHSMLDEKMEKSKKYTWHLLHGIQKNVFFIKLLPFLTMIFVEAQLRALRKSPVGALRRSDRTCSTFTQKRLLLGLRYSWKEREWRANVIKVKVKLSIGDRIGEKKIQKKTIKLLQINILF